MESCSHLINYIFENGYNGSADKAKELVETTFDKFIFNLEFEKTFEIEFDIRKEFENVFHKYCSDYGKSETQIGEILRGLMKLCYRYENDGDEIEVGPYSGIWYGLKEKLECPFIACDYGVEWKTWDGWDNFNTVLSHAMGRDYVSNIALNALILATFYDFHCKNYYDISEYYKNIVECFVDENVLKKFTDNGIMLNHNFGCYSYPDMSGAYSSFFTINSIAEDMHINISLNQKQFNIEYMCGGVKFKLEFDFEIIDTILADYGDVLRYLVHLATVDYKKHICSSYIEEDLNNIGFTVKDGYIVKQ